MGHPRRYFPSKSVYFITNRLADGLPFVPNEYINAFIFGILARGLFKYPGISISCFQFMQNHYHIVLVLNASADTLRDFMNFLNGELGKVVCRWLGCRNVKVWAQRYHPALLLTPEATLQRMAYTLANPVFAEQSPTASSFSGCSSFYALNESVPRQYHYYTPSQAALLPNAPFKRKLRKLLLRDLQDKPAPIHPLPIDPFGWLGCFPETKNLDQEIFKTQLFKEIAAIETSVAAKLKKEKRNFPEVELLKQQNPHKPYKPLSRGRRVVCISTCPEQRQEFINLYRTLCKEAKKAWQLLCARYIPMKLPLGFFVPPVRSNHSCLPIYGHL